MKYHDLRDFIAQLEKLGELKRIAAPVSPHLEMTEICDRVLRAQGPAILFENPAGHAMPVLANLFGTPRRVALGMGEESTAALREVGKLLAYLKEPEPPKGLKDAWEKWPVLKQVLTMSPKVLSAAPCQEIVWEGKDVDLGRLPIQYCWPGDVAPLITWGLVVTRGPLQDAPESRHLPPAGDRAEQGHHALAGAARRRAGFSRPLRKESGPAVPARGGDRRRSGDHTRRGDAGAGRAFRIPVRRSVARQQDRTGQVPGQRPAGAGISRDRAGRRDPSGRDRAGRPVRRPHRLLQRAGDVPGVHHRAHHHARATRSTIPPTPASRRTNRRCWAWR